MSARGVGLAAGLVLALAAASLPAAVSAEGQDGGWRVQLTPYPDTRFAMAHSVPIRRTDGAVPHGCRRMQEVSRIVLIS